MKKKNDFTKKDFLRLLFCCLFFAALFAWSHFSKEGKDFLGYSGANINTSMAVETSMPEEYVSVIRQNCDGYDSCYMNLFAWESDFGGIDFGSCVEGDLVCANKIAVAKIEGSWTYADANRVSINGWTTDEDHYVKIYTDASARHTGKWDNTRYRLFPTAITQYNLEIHEDYTWIGGLAIGRNGGKDGVTTDRGVVLISGAKNVRFDNNIVQQYKAPGHGVVLEDDADNFKGKNNLVYDCTYGFYFHNSSGSRLYNSSMIGNQRGVQISTPGAVLYLKNCLASGGSIGFVADEGMIDAQYCASGDGTADDFGGEGNRVNQNFDLVEIVYADDYHLTANDNGARNKGMDLSEDPDYPVMYDSEGALRPGEDVWDIGYDEYGEAEVVEPEDTTEPGISGGSLSGTLAAGTTETVLSVSTNENATCRYATKADLDYMEMTETFSTTGEMTHTQSVSGLVNGQSYSYYVRCKDEAGNTNNAADYVISFSVAEMTSSAIHEGDLIRAVGDIDIYIVKFVGGKMFKRLILSPSVFESYGHLKWENVKEVLPSIADMYTTSDLVRAAGDTKVYKLYPAGDTGERRWVETAEAFNRNGYDWDAIYEINEVDRDSYVNGAGIE